MRTARIWQKRGVAPFLRPPLSKSSESRKSSRRWSGRWSAYRARLMAGTDGGVRGPSVRSCEDGDAEGIVCDFREVLYRSSHAL